MEFLDRMYLMITCSLYSFFHDEEGAVDIVAVVVLIGIAVVLAVLFRENIQDLLETLFETIQGKATEAVN